MIEPSNSALSQYRTIKHIVYDELRRAIVTGKYSAGSRLVADHIARQLGVSPTPVREALHRLEAEGLVRVNPHHGVEVSQLSIQEIIEIYHIRGALESLATRLAAEHLTGADFDRMNALLDDMDDAARVKDLERILSVNRQFHGMIWQATQSPKLSDLLENYYDSSQRFRYVSITIPGRLDRISFEHRRITRALLDGDIPLAGVYATEHYEGTAQYLLSSLRENPILQ
ncbi:MAG: GntR family transcriptional regulator [Anaerolineae bacterium]|nr:GntR family transcriptional regulator [Anaerolineae bacterium]